MGAIYSRFNEPLRSCSGSVTQIIRGRKRKHAEIESDSSEEIESSIQKSLNTPIKKKLLTTPQYIYKTFFVEEQNSDVSVMALGRVWRLHKIYLCQSEYFRSMFNGSWREREQNFITIEIIDPKITLDALNIVFGSLYLDEVTMDPKQVVSVLAAAALFQLDGLIEKCCEIMNSNINAQTAIPYYDAAVQYGAVDVKNNAFNWLLINLLSFYSKTGTCLQLLSIDLISDLIASADLIVMQTEFALYALLKVWTYLKIHQVDDDEYSMPNDTPLKITTDSTINQEIIGQASSYFSNLKLSAPFLQTPFGKKFMKPFTKLRFQHLINHPVDIKLIFEDNIIPKSWMYMPFMLQWNSLIKIDNCLDTGPVDVDEKTFYRGCLRCGRVLDDDSYQKWRWTGFNFGVDLVLIADTRMISIKRHHRTENERLLSLQAKRNIMLRVTILSLNDRRQIHHSQTTGVKTIQLDRNEENCLIYLDSELVYPILISVNLLVTTPNKLPAPPTPIPLEAFPSTSGQVNTVDSNEYEISTIGNTKSTDNDESNLNENIDLV